MYTYHIHITGIVQGVGFRPLVSKLAEKYRLNGRVCNDTDGVHILLNSNPTQAAIFLDEIISNPPRNALIREYKLQQVDDQAFADFRIDVSRRATQPDLLLTPDLAICGDCAGEIEQQANRRFQYPFTTCLQCGPRYSIMNELPYDRERTTMAPYEMCETCNREYGDIHDRRHYSQTNSCHHCAIPMHLYNAAGREMCGDYAEQITKVLNAIRHGKIVAVKGIGGYLLMCDAHNGEAVGLLRQRKHRPAKPFAVMYDSVEAAENDVWISATEKEALLSREAPIVLCNLKNEMNSGLQTGLIADGLDKLGVFLPYTPLLKMITTRLQNPLIATSGNLNGSPIVFRDGEALEGLRTFADLILAFDRDIVTPQDDSVIQFTPGNQQVILRRSRGLAPNFFPNPFKSQDSVLALGAEMKGAFAVLEKNNLFISQFLGRLDAYESQQSFVSALEHLTALLRFRAMEILVDKHPGYFATQHGKELASKMGIPLTRVQHHVAHACAVLGENNLLQEREKVLCVAWDGTGYGDDEQIWGSEFFVFEEGDFKRVSHLRYFPQILGDKMSREPRLSAFSLLNGDISHVETHFEKKELDYYSRLMQREGTLQTSSMGRFLDGIASLLGLKQVNTFEGEAAMKLEVAARRYRGERVKSYSIEFDGIVIDWRPVIAEIRDDISKGVDTDRIAARVFETLIGWIDAVAARLQVRKIAVSGGVFQNAFLVDLMQQRLGRRYRLFYHRQLSPNDECISFGQLAYRQMMRRRDNRNSLEN